MNSPLVLPLRPGLGWNFADRPRRAFAVLGLALLACWPVLLRFGGEVGDTAVALSALTIGPPAFYSLARILRPHLVEDTERELRHWCASTTTCFGVAVLIALTVAGGDLVALFIVPALLGLNVTLAWGVVAMVVRAVRTPVPLPPWSPPPHGLTVLPAVSER